jgi:hypothetical protein
MAYENIRIAQPNFCRGPLAGTFCTLDTSAGTTVLKMVNTTGAVVSTYVLGSNIVNDLLSLEYVGPLNLSSLIDGLVFFTLEKLSTSTCIIKRWETRTSTLQLNLKQTIIKSDTGSYYYNAKGMAVEHYRTTFQQDCEGGVNFMEVSGAANITNGDSLFLGPSSDTDNPGAHEVLTVSTVANKTVYFTSNILNQYAEGDPVTLYKRFHLLSDTGVGGDTDSATFFRLSLTGGIEATSSSPMYKGINAMKWYSGYRSIASVHHKNLLFILPYTNYTNSRSMFLNNYGSNKVDEFEVADIVFDGSTLYKLMNSCTRRDDSGQLIEIVWSEYNYLADSLLPYANTMQLYAEDDYMIGKWDLTEIMVKVRDQFNVGLRDLTIQLYKVGDTQAEFDPLDGQIDTNINGYAEAGYQSGTIYAGHTKVSGRVAGGSLFNGSQYVWGNFNILSKVGEEDTPMSVFQVGSVSYDGRPIRQLSPEVTIESNIRAKSKFQSPGGDYIPTSPPDSQSDKQPLDPVGFETLPDGTVIPEIHDMDTLFPLPNRITVVKAFDSIKNIKSVKEFLTPMSSEKGEELPDVYVSQRYQQGEMSLSQLHMSKHSYWVSGVYYDYLWTYNNLNQFVFVEDAIPKFWSEKNPKATNIWIRLRPFANSLNSTTLRMSVREVSYEGDTGYVDVSDQLSVTPFDAGGGLLGLEVLYDPLTDYHHDAVVYVSIQVYDTAYDPNFIWVNYWFSIIPDYRFPYLDNLDPPREQTNVPVDTVIEFDVKDAGVGVDISTLEMFVNSRMVVPVTTRVSDNEYHVVYTPVEPLMYGKRYNVKVHVADASENVNWLNDRYNFYTRESSGVDLVPLYPKACKRGMPVMTDVAYLALAAGDGVDQSTLRLQVAGKDLTPHSKILPVVYRIS